MREPFSRLFTVTVFLLQGLELYTVEVENEKEVTRMLCLPLAQ